MRKARLQFSKQSSSWTPSTRRWSRGEQSVGWTSCPCRMWRYCTLKTNSCVCTGFVSGMNSCLMSVLVSYNCEKKHERDREHVFCFCVLQALGRNNLQNPVVSLFSDIRVNWFELFFFFFITLTEAAWGSDVFWFQRPNSPRSRMISVLFASPVERQVISCREQTAQSLHDVWVQNDYRSFGMNCASSQMWKWLDGLVTCLDSHTRQISWFFVFFFLLFFIVLGTKVFHKYDKLTLKWFTCPTDL